MRISGGVVSVVLVVVSSACVTARFELNGNADRGRPHFERLCAQCHGGEGRGDGPAATATAIDPKPTNFTDPRNAERLTEKWVYEVIRDGGPSHEKSPLMVSWSGSLDEGQIRDVAAWVMKLKQAGAARPADVPAP